MAQLEHSHNNELDDNEEETSSKITIVWENINSKNLVQSPSNKNNNKSKYNRSNSVIISQNNHSRKNGVSESKINYDYMDGTDTAKLVGGAGIGYALGAYAIDLAVEQTFMATVGAELAYAAGIGAWGGLLGVGVASLTALGMAGYTYMQNQKENEKLQLKKQFNRKVTIFNEKIKEFQLIAKNLKILKNKLKEQESELLKNTFLFERVDFNSKSILLIGPTGYGKSTIANRLMGRNEDILDLSECDDITKILYPVAKYGSKISKTTNIKKVTKKVTMTTIIKNSKTLIFKEKEIFNLSVIDTAGAFDSKNREIYQTNEMLEFYRSFGGVNMFCIVIRFNDKFDANYQKLLKKYENFWDKMFWKHCCVIISYCDKDSQKGKKILHKKLKYVKKEIQEELDVISNGKCKNIPMFDIGEENFQQTLKNMFKTLNLRHGRFEDKYVCNKISSPIDKAWNDVNNQYKLYKSKAKEIKLLKRKLDEMKSNLDK